MANFVGVVTQQDTQTGVTLRARVTSPKGHYTAYQDFRCMVKKAGLTDEQAVMTDLNTISNKLLANGVTGITSNLTAYMPSVGENETNVKYVVSGDDISEYFNSDGIVTKRPPYGSNSVVGSLTITVTKNAAIAERNITIGIEPYTAQELVQSVLNTITWDNIRGNNAAESSDPSTNGINFILNFFVLSSCPKILNKSPNIGICFSFLNSPFSLYKLLSSKLIFFNLYTCINFSSNKAFSSSSSSPNIKLKKPINLLILIAKYPFSPSSMLSFLISKTFI